MSCTWRLFKLVFGGLAVFFGLILWGMILYDLIVRGALPEFAGGTHQLKKLFLLVVLPVVGAKWLYDALARRRKPAGR
jgi:hypothetical protein